jgi:flagellar basal body P-ring protein FlgI
MSLPTQFRQTIARMRLHSQSSFMTAVILALVAIAGAGCKAVDVTSWFQDEDERLETNAREALSGRDGHPRRIGDYVAVNGMQPRVIRGVGLVVGLRDTGEDPPASVYRTMLLEDMRRRDVQNPNEILQSTKTALVIVTGYVPPLIRKGDRIDISVQLPPGSQATSLAGGRLIECELIEQGYVDGQVLEGHTLGKAEGHILVSTRDDVTSVMTQRSGVIPGGAVYIGDDEDLSLYMRPDYRNWRIAQRIAQQIGRRFDGYDDGGQRVPLAEAQTDYRIRLTLDDQYRDYPDRYLRVIREIRLSEQPVEQSIRMQSLQEKLLVGPTAGQAALELEAIGNDAVPILKEGLGSPSFEARFYAAEALAYLGRVDGVATLAEAADKEPAFRVFSLAALAALKKAEAVLALQELLKHESVETRAGAWRALTIISRDNPTIPSTVVNDQFRLYVMDSPTPLIHITRTMDAEIAIFGADQRFLAPLMLEAGPDIMIRAESGGQVATVTYISSNQPMQKIQVPLNVDSVIRAAAGLGATYPDIVQMLLEADEQYNLEGPVAIDEYPEAGRVYQRPGSELAIGGESAAQAVTAGEMPWLFGGHPEDDVNPEGNEVRPTDDAALDEQAAVEESSTDSERHLSPSTGHSLTPSDVDSTSAEAL